MIFEMLSRALKVLKWKAAKLRNSLYHDVVEAKLMKITTKCGNSWKSDEERLWIADKGKRVPTKGFRGAEVAEARREEERKGEKKGRREEREEREKKRRKKGEGKGRRRQNEGLEILKGSRFVWKVGNRVDDVGRIITQPRIPMFRLRPPDLNSLPPSCNYFNQRL